MKLIILIFILLIFYLVVYKYYEYFTSVDRKKLIVKNNEITKYHKNKEKYFKIKNLYKKKLNKFNFVPKMTFNDNTLCVQEEYIKDKLTKTNKPYNYESQLRNIHNTLLKNNIYHNDLNYNEHIRIKNNKIYIIDFDSVTKKESNWGRKSKGNNIEYIINKYKN